MFCSAPDCSDTRAVVVKRCKEAIVLGCIEHVDQTVPGNGREQQQKSDYFDDNDGNWWHIYYNDDKGDNLDAEARYDAALGPFLPLSPASEYSRQST